MCVFKLLALVCCSNSRLCAYINTTSAQTRQKNLFKTTEQLCRAQILRSLFSPSSSLLLLLLFPLTTNNTYTRTHTFTAQFEPIGTTTDPNGQPLTPTASSQPTLAPPAVISEKDKLRKEVIDAITAPSGKSTEERAKEEAAFFDELEQFYVSPPKK